MQRTLFETRAPPKPEPPKYRVPLEKNPVKSPWSHTDKHGNLFWQKMHKTLEKMPVEMREFFNHVTQLARPDDLDQLEKALRMFNRANEMDRIDFDVSRGRL